MFMCTINIFLNYNKITKIVYGEIGDLHFKIRFD